jgi:pimeloyl-ACP methyl ester carboxylesterase
MRKLPTDHAVFKAMPVQQIALGQGVSAAVHIAGDLASGNPPVVCLAGYNRNMSDFSDFAAYYTRASAGKWPLVLIDLPGRGRATDRPKRQGYNSILDSQDVASILAALGIGRAVFLGQGHGGQVAMLVAAAHPVLFAGTILVDAGPVTDTRGLVRMRGNLEHISRLRGDKAIHDGFQTILSASYPGVRDEHVTRLTERTHFRDAKGRLRALFDPRLMDAFKDINFDDVLTPQWALFDALRCAPLMLLRTQLTDQLRRETFEEMVKRRPDAVALTISGQGSPALFDQKDETEAVATFVSGFCTKLTSRVP